jgi:hypothetical protein
MFRKSGDRFSDQNMLKQSMFRKSGDRFSDQNMLRHRT